MSAKKYAIIVAGGAGTRAGSEIPKQFCKIRDIPMLWWSVRAFYEEDPEVEIRIVMHPGFFDLWDILHDELPEADRKIPYTLVCGGRSRAESVANGLYGIPEAPAGDAMVAIHDAARPMIDHFLIKRGWEAAHTNKAAIPVIPMTDTIRRLDEDGESVTEDRDRYVRVQTPQVFDLDLLKKAYIEAQSDISARTDDASVIEAMGHKVSLYEGSPRNIKVTYPDDFLIAETLLKHAAELKDASEG